MQIAKSAWTPVSSATEVYASVRFTTTWKKTKETAAANKIHAIRLHCHTVRPSMNSSGSRLNSSPSTPPTNNVTATVSGMTANHAEEPSENERNGSSSSSDSRLSVSVPTIAANTI